MANITGLIGYNKQSLAVSKLLAAYGNDVIDVATGLGASLNLTAGNNVEFTQFIDKVYGTNYSELPFHYDGTSWSRSDTIKSVYAKYMRPYKNRLYFGNTKIVTLTPTTFTYTSRVFFTELPFQSTTRSFAPGMTYGSNLSITQGSPIVTLTAPTQFVNFQQQGIKVGDPIFIVSSNVLDQYLVQSIDSAYRLTLTKPIVGTTASNVDFWVGSNWFDVDTDDGDSITGFGENSDNLLVFKLLSFSFYNGTQLRKVQDSPGTSSQRSVINSKGYTYYFHGSHPDISGIYRYDGVASVLSSRAIDPFIRGMNTTNYTSVISWKEGNNLRFFLGDLTNTNYNISMTNAVATLNTATNAWSVDPIADIITAKTVWRTNNREDTYTGTSDNQVLKMNNGNDHNATPIRMRLETKVIYPAGVETTNLFTRIQIISRNAKGLRVGYKLWNTPSLVDDTFRQLGEIKTDKTEILVPNNHQFGSGMQLVFDDYNILENDAYVEKVILFYMPETIRVQQNYG